MTDQPTERPPRARAAAAALALTLLALAHVAALAPLPPPVRAAGAWAILLAPGALVGALAFPAQRDPLVRGWVMLCGGLTIAALLMMALLALPGPLPPWLALGGFDGLAAAAGALLLRRTPAGPAETAGAPHPLPALLVVALLGGGLRLLGIGGAEMHVDEARVLLVATAVVRGDDAAIFARDKGPVEVLLVSGPLALTGQLSELGGRLPFALAGIGTMLGAYLLARALWHGEDDAAGAAAGLMAAALLAVDGLMIGFSRTIQYQSVVLLMTVAALWCAAQLRARTAAWAGLLACATCLAVGLLAHYDAGYAAPAMALLVMRGLWGRPLGVAVRPLAASAGVGATLLASFFVPFVAQPRFAEYTLHYLSRRVGGTSSAPGLVNNLGLYEPVVTFYSAAVPVYTVATLLVAGALLWMARYARPRALGLAGAALLLAGCAVQLLRPELFTAAGGANLAIVAFAPPIALALARRTPLPLRVLLLWFGAVFISHAFLIAVPNTHFFGMHVPAALLAGWGTITLGRMAPERARRWLAAGASAAVVGMVAYAAVHANVVFVQPTPEYLRTYPSARLPFYPTSYGDSLPADQGWYGFPRQDGWKAVGVLYRLGVLRGTYDSNQKREVTGWYTRGQPRCDTAPANYVITYRESYIVPGGYQLSGYVRVAGERVIALYRRTRVAGLPQEFDAETLGGVDGEPLDALPVAGALGEALPQHPLPGAGALLGYDLDRATLAPDEVAQLAIYWDAARAAPGAQPTVTLVDAGGQAAGAVRQICPPEPAVRWRPTTLQVAWLQVAAPRSLAPGDYTLQAQLGAERVVLSGFHVSR